MLRLMFGVMVCLFLAACGGDGDAEATPEPLPPTAIPLEETIATTRPDFGELTVSYPSDWVAVEVQGGQVEVATSDEALMLLVEPSAEVAAGDVVGQISLFVDDEIVANTALTTIDDPAETLMAIITALNFAETLAEDAAPQTSNGEVNVVIYVDGQFGITDIERRVRCVLVPVDGGVAFGYFTAQDENGFSRIETTVMTMLSRVTFMEDSS